MSSLSVLFRLTVGVDAATPISKGRDNGSEYTFRFVFGDGMLLVGPAATADGPAAVSDAIEAAILGVDAISVSEVNLMAFRPRDKEGIAFFDKLGTLRLGDVVDIACSIEWASFASNGRVQRGLRLGPIESLVVVERASGGSAPRRGPVFVDA